MDCKIISTKYRNSELIIDRIEISHYIYSARMRGAYGYNQEKFSEKEEEVEIVFKQRRLGLLYGNSVRYIGDLVDFISSNDFDKILKEKNTGSKVKEILKGRQSFDFKTYNLLLKHLEGNDIATNDLVVYQNPILKNEGLPYTIDFLINEIKEPKNPIALKTIVWPNAYDGSYGIL